MNLRFLLQLLQHLYSLLFSCASEHRSLIDGLQAHFQPRLGATAARLTVLAVVTVAFATYVRARPHIEGLLAANAALYHDNPIWLYFRKKLTEFIRNGERHAGESPQTLRRCFGGHIASGRRHGARYQPCQKPVGRLHAAGTGILFGEGGQIPKYIGPHRLVMSLEEARQIEGEALPKFLIGFYIGGFVGAGFDAATNPNSTKGSRTRSALTWGIGGGAGGAPGGFIAGPIAGGAAQVGCNACHEVK